MSAANDELEQLRAELAGARKAISQLMDDGDVNDLMRPVVAERDALKATVEQSRGALAAFDGRGQIGVLVNSYDVPTPYEVLEAWRASLAAPKSHGDAS